VVYKSCPDLTRLTGVSTPVVNSDSEYRAAYKPSAEYNRETDNTNNSAPTANTADAAAAAAADNNDNGYGDDDGISEVCAYLYVFLCIVVVKALAS